MFARQSVHVHVFGCALNFSPPSLLWSIGRDWDLGRYGQNTKMLPQMVSCSLKVSCTSTNECGAHCHHVMCACRVHEGFALGVCTGMNSSVAAFRHNWCRLCSNNDFPATVFGLLHNQFRNQLGSYKLLIDCGSCGGSRMSHFVQEVLHAVLAIFGDIRKICYN